MTKHSNCWKINKDKTKPHWLQVQNNNGDFGAIVKWDGCIHLHSYGNIPYDNDPERKNPDCCDDYIHICDLDELIRNLQSLKEIAIKHFGKDWAK